MIVGVENTGIGERGKNSSYQILWVCHCDSVRSFFPLHPTKSPEIFLILKRSSQASRGCTHIQRALSGLQVQRTLISAERSSRSRCPLQLVDDYPMRGPSRQAEVTRIYRGRFQACKCKGLSYLQRSSRSYWPLQLVENYPMRGPSRLMVTYSSFLRTC